ncbi:MAG: 30S ribosomal protein S20 [Ruminococcaceae bacterium]|nr:30S ribosomal protein S20 [Oscillospiraceae bacterium]
MPNIKSAKKRNVLSKVQNARNKATRSALRTQLRKFDAVIAEGDANNAKESYKVAVKHVDRAVAKGLIHKNKAANTKSAMALRINALSAE